MSQLRTFWAIVKKDLATWIRSPLTIAVTILPAIILMFVLILQAAAVTGSPVAIVNEDPGGQAAVSLQRIAQHYDGFYHPQVLSKAAAEKEYNNLSVAGVLIIPKGFSKEMAAGKHPSVIWQVRNFNNDTANDLRRALPDILSTFLQSQPGGGASGSASGSSAGTTGSTGAKSTGTSTGTSAGSSVGGSVGSLGASPLRIQVHEHDLNARDVSFVGFNMIAVVVMLVLQAGIVNAGLAAVREWESGSIKELLMSPARPLTMILGKVGAGVVASDITGGIALIAAMAAGIVHVPSFGLALLALLTITLTAVVGSGLGVLLGALARATERLSGLSISLSFYLFFLAGGITDIAYLPRWLQVVSTFVPNTYSLDALRQTLLYGSTGGIFVDLVVLACAALIALVIGIPVMRRGLSH